MTVLRSTDSAPATDTAALSPAALGVLQASVLVVALCGIVYELLIAAVASYLIGDSVRQFSITIGLFMAAMGVGSFASKHVGTKLVERFVAVEIVLALVGGLSTGILFLAFPTGDWFRPVMVGLTLLIGFLVGLEIPLITRVLSDREGGGVRRSIAHVLALDYFGALVGSVAFPLLLLPFLGLFRAAFAIGLLNAIVAAANVLVFAGAMNRRPLFMALSLAVAGLLTGGMFIAPTLTRLAERQLYDAPIVYHQQTPYQRLVVTRDRITGDHALFIDGHLQFHARDEYRYHEALVHPLMALPGDRSRVLILGGGDGLAARELLRYDDIGQIDLVDLDPAMTRLARDFGPLRRLNKDALRDERVTVHNADAFTFLRETQDRFDRVVIDLPDPHNEALVKLYSVEFYRLLASRLAGGGAIVTQGTSPFLTRRTFWTIAETMRAAGLGVTSYRAAVPSFGVWGFHLAAIGAAPALAVDELPPGLRYLTPTVVASMTDFPADEAPLADVSPQSMFEPRLYMIYRSELMR